MDCNREELVEENVGLAYHIAKRYKNSPIRREELKSIAIEGLCIAAKNFNFDYGVKFTTYAGRIINNEILMRLRKEKYQQYLEDYKYEDDHGNKIKFKDDIIDKIKVEGGYSDIDDKDYFEDFKERIMMNCLDDSEIDVLFMYYIKNMTQTEISEKMDRSQSYISRKIKRSLKTLENNMCG